MSAADLDRLRAGFVLTGAPAVDVPAFLSRHGRSATASHCGYVAATAARVAQRAGVDPVAAATAGWLHDVSAIWPAGERVTIAKTLGVPVLPEEAAFPMIVHQKLSVVLARDVFGVRDVTVLGAIGCHTTLRAGATALDKVVFVADKLAWDGRRYLWERGADLPVVHPWLRQAYAELTAAEAR